MRSYWSNSKLAHWLQKRAGIKVMGSGTVEEWSAWRKESSAKSKFIFWLTEDGLDKIQDFLCYPLTVLGEMRYAFINRFINKTHMLQTRLKPGKYHEVETRMLHGLFETLVDFIEVEKAWMQVVCSRNSEDYKKFGYRWYETNRLTNWIFSRRHPEAGLEYLRWEMSLVCDDAWYGNDPGSIEQAKLEGKYGKPTFQGEAAKEQFELYNWWKNIRPKRKDPMDESGYTAYFDLKRKIAKENGEDDDFLSGLAVDTTPELREMQRAASQKCNELEKRYEDEDEEMLIRLIKVRRSLWT